MAVEYLPPTPWSTPVRLAKIKHETANDIYQSLREKYPIATRTPEQWEIVNAADDEMCATGRAWRSAKLSDPQWSTLIWGHSV